MPRKLNDTQIAEIVYKHATGTSISKLSSDYGVGRNTIRRYLDNEANLEQKCSEIKNESVTEWLKAKKDTIMGLLDQIIGLLPKRLKDASVKDLMGAYKILTETSINNVEGKGDGSNEGEAISVNITFAKTGERDGE